MLGQPARSELGHKPTSHLPLITMLLMKEAAKLWRSKNKRPRIAGPNDLHCIMLTRG